MRRTTLNKLSKLEDKTARNFVLLHILKHRTFKVPEERIGDALALLRKDSRNFEEPMWMNDELVRCGMKPACQWRTILPIVIVCILLLLLIKLILK